MGHILLLNAFCMSVIFCQMPDIVKFFGQYNFVFLYIFLNFDQDTVKLNEKQFHHLRLAFKTHLARQELSLIQDQLFNPTPSPLRQNLLILYLMPCKLLVFLICSVEHTIFPNLCVFQVFFLLILSGGSVFAATIVSSQTCVDQYSTKHSDFPLQISGVLSLAALLSRL